MAGNGRLFKQDSMQGTIEMFRQYANSVLQEQIEKLKEEDNNLVSGKLARLNLFNTHFSVLKQHITNKEKEILDDNRSLVEYDELAKEINSIKVECINEYLHNNFGKDSY